jgi:catechol 2,3-dioxygenase-like lactoylglutathione lyase family enzyme
MIKTYGLTHIALAVRETQRSFRFYQQVLDMVQVYRENGFIQAQTPGSRDVIVFDEDPARAGQPGGVVHFGFRLTDPADIEAAGQAVERAGGRILDRGEFWAGEPYLFAADPDGYEIEIWYELPTALIRGKRNCGVSDRGLTLPNVRSSLSGGKSIPGNCRD